MIATLTEIKNIIGILQSNTTYDSRIITFMPIIEEEISNICKQYFISDIDLENEKFLGVNTLSFESSSYKILDSDNQLDRFVAGNTIRVFNSIDNDGIYYISSVAVDGSYLVIDSDYASLFDESAANDKYISIYKLSYENALKFPFSQMVKFRLSKDSLPRNVDTEKIDDYWIRYKDSNIIKGYPKEIINSLQPYRKYYWDKMLIQTY